jgi:hypothetical protein
MGMNVKETKKFIQYCAKTKLVPLLLGHTGIGKTQILEQIANEDGKDLIILHAAQIEPSDFVGLYKINADGKTDNCAPSWLPYKHPTKEMIEKGVPRNQGYINPNGGYLFLDEINKAHEDVRQALYQLLNTKRLHTYQLPDNYTIVAAGNPANTAAGYEVNDFDRALINRIAWVKFQPEQKETLEHLKSIYGLSPVISWIESQSLRATDTTQLIDYGAEDFEITDLCYSPRMTENHIILWDIIHAAGESDIFKRKALETIMQPEKVASYISYMQDLYSVTYVDVLQGKVKTEKIKELLNTKRLDILGYLVRELSSFWSTHEIGKSSCEHFEQKDEEKVIKRTTDFMAGLPDELVMFFLDVLSNYKTLRSITENEYFKQKIKREKLAANKEAILKA